MDNALASNRALRARVAALEGALGDQGELACRIYSIIGLAVERNDTLLYERSMRANRVRRALLRPAAGKDEAGGRSLTPPGSATSPSAEPPCPDGAPAGPCAQGQYTTPSPAESFEEWHRRECPELNFTKPGMVCTELIVWGPAGMKKKRQFIGRTCREVYQFEHSAPGKEGA